MPEAKANVRDKTEFRLERARSDLLAALKRRVQARSRQRRPTP